MWVVVLKDWYVKYEPITLYNQLPLLIHKIEQMILIKNVFPQKRPAGTIFFMAFFKGHTTYNTIT